MATEVSTSKDAGAPPAAPTFPEARELLTELVRIESPSRQEGDAVRCLVDWMGAQGMEAWVDEVGNACGTRGDGPRLLILLGHIDTVPGWIRVRVEDDILHGRGSVDAKGSLCAFAGAAALADPPPGWKVMVVGATEEEISTSTGACHLREIYQPDLCVIGEPSGADRVTLGYKGRLLVDVTVVQPVHHSARPEPTAAAVASDLWQRIANWATERNRGRDRYFDQIQASLKSINTHSDGLEDSADLTIGFRLPLDCDADQTLEAIGPWLDDHHWKAYGAEKAYRAPRSSSLARRMVRAINGRGGQGGLVLKTGTSDMNIVGVRWDCPIVAYGPGDSNLDHTPHEQLPLAEFDRAVETLRRLVASLGTEV